MEMSKRTNKEEDEPILFIQKPEKFFSRQKEKQKDTQRKAKRKAKCQKQAMENPR